MKSAASIFAMGWSGVLFIGCHEPVREEPKEEAPIPVAKVEQEPSSTQTIESRSEKAVPARPEVADIEGVKFTIPAGWKRVDLASGQAGFISARYLIPVEDQELQLTFSTARGGIDANFERWRGQFRLKPGIEPIQDRIVLSRGEAHWLDLRGTYTSGTGFTSNEPDHDVRMIGIGIPLTDGEMYLKLLGPEPLVGRITGDMRELVKSADLP